VNVVSNPTFAGASLSPWVWSSTGNGRYVFVAGHTSTYALDLYTTSGASSSTITQSMPTVAGNTYTFSMNYLVQNGNNAASVFEASFDNTNANIYAISLQTTPKHTWRTLQITFLASSSSTTITLKLNTAAIASVYLDAISAVTPC
jgi:hypothetical protein